MFGLETMEIVLIAAGAVVVIGGLFVGLTRLRAKAAAAQPATPARNG